MWSPAEIPSSASRTRGSNTIEASGAPSSPCFGAVSSSVSGDRTVPTATASNLVSDGSFIPPQLKPAFKAAAWSIADASWLLLK